MVTPPRKTSPTRRPPLAADPADRARPSSVTSKTGAKRKPAAKGEARPPKPRRTSSGKAQKTGRSWPRRLMVWGTTAAIWAAIALLGVVGYYAHDLPDIDEVTATSRRPAVSFVSADGETFASYGDLYGEPVTLKTVSPYLPKAVLATEDRRFYSHFGVDPWGLARAMAANIRAGRVVQGGSTITQQLAKNLFLTPDRNIKRKVQEVLMALWLEHRFSKDQILTLYLNRVYLGAGTHGVDAAARQYFGSRAKDLSLYQSALVAGLLKAPSRYNPRNNAQASHARTRQVLVNMVAAGAITQAEADRAEKVGPGSVRRFVPGGRYFADWLHEQITAFAGSEARDLIVYTTLDMRLQRKAEAALEKMLAGPGAKANVSQGAVVVMGPDGAVRAMVGGRDFDSSQFNRSTQGLRQPGSAFKPFVFLAALERGLTPDSVVEDTPFKIGKWSPSNFNNKYEGPVTLSHALARSSNTVAARLAVEIGPENVAALAKRLGITSDMRPDASISLGTSEATLLEMASAYAVFANGGFGAWPYGIAEIRDGAHDAAQRQGKVVYRRQGGGPGRLVSERDIARLNHMMAGVVETGTGRAAALPGRAAAGKTGTTQDHRDAWFMGYTADAVAGVWLGNDDGAPMKRVTGSTLPAQLWRQVMLDAHAGLPPKPLPGTEKPWDAPMVEVPAIKELPSAIGGLFDSLLKTLLGN